jgi:hypothetical protein
MNDCLRSLSVCGVCCPTDCKAYQTECEGCVALGGGIPWAVFYDREFCPIFDCVRDKGFSSCADCGLAPCQVWLDTRDPSASDGQFAADLANRLSNLKKLSDPDPGD